MRSTTKPGGYLTYGVVSKFDPDAGRVRSFIVATCHQCGGTEHLPWNKASNAPDPIARAFRNRGWLFDKHNAKQCICPKCQQQESTSMAVRPANPDPKVTPLRKPHHTAEAMAAATDETTADLQAAMRPLSPEQRQRIRHALDQHFDDSKGVYLDGKSDKVLGEELNLPWRHVTDLREFAYGPLRGDPALDDAGTRIAELSALTKRLEDQLRKCEEDAKEIRRQLSEVSCQVGAIRARFS